MKAHPPTTAPPHLFVGSRRQSVPPAVGGPGARRPFADRRSCSPWRRRAFPNRQSPRRPPPLARRHPNESRWCMNIIPSPPKVGGGGISAPRHRRCSRGGGRTDGAARTTSLLTTASPACAPVGGALTVRLRERRPYLPRGHRTESDSSWPGRSRPVDSYKSRLVDKGWRVRCFRLRNLFPGFVE